MSVFNTRGSVNRRGVGPARR